jgi:four helix bundle suffix protein
VAQLVFDVTARFCQRWIERNSRTRDQMVQAARSGVQNIAEGSQAAGTSKKTELKLTNVARASLEELKLDYEDFLRQRSLSLWPLDDPRRQQLVNRRCQTADDVARWVKELCDGQDGQDGRNGQRLSYQEAAANAAHVLIGVACALLDRQIQRLAKDFTEQGGFTERLHRTRTKHRNENP